MEEVRVGIIGVGSMGSSHVNSVMETPRAKLTAVCDISKETADKFAKQHDLKAYYTADELLTSGEVDAVIIATPHYDHTTISVAAFEQGLHVLTEKPIAVHKQDAEKMIEAHAKRPDLKFGAMFQQRTSAGYKKLKSLLESGELGEVKRVNWIITDWFRSQTYYDSGGWRATWKGEGGGVLLNQCPHNLDLFQWLFGMPTKIRAYCAIGKYHNIEVEDDVTAYLEYPNGATGVFITSTAEAPGTNRLEITCDRGRVVYEGGKITFTRSEVPVKEFCATTDTRFGTPDMWDVSVRVGNSPKHAHQHVIECFVNAILDDTDLVAKAEEGINSVELANCMLYSSLTDTTVELPLDSAAFAAKLQELIENSTFVKAEEKEVDDDFSKSFNG